jgi:hypothetical protein
LPYKQPPKIQSQKRKDVLICIVFTYTGKTIKIAKNYNGMKNWSQGRKAEGVGAYNALHDEIACPNCHYKFSLSPPGSIK